MAQPTPRIWPASPLHPGFIGAGSTLLISAFLTDVMYYTTSIWQWANFSAWLIAAGLVLALVATIVLVIDFVIGRASRISWVSFFVVAAAALLSLLNVLIHSRDSWTSVVPEGIGLSAVVTILLLVAAVRGWRVATVRAEATGERV
ncbi:MAG TPA: DUF2231 domain-containing protein [Caulobacteraceae bacterium]|jgi:uncharacterized membrane protein|nr:DUF2231 domain-containing protein [Caulobacteraceae bacterium]